jgi:hypothetical protein
MGLGEPAVHIGAEVRDAAAAWTGRVDTVIARTDRPPVLSAALTVVSDSLGTNQAADKRGIRM